MKNKFPVLLLFLFSTLCLSAQEDIIPVQLNWKGIEKAYADTTYKELIALERAVYFENDLPHYHYNTEFKSGFNYSPKVINPVFIPVDSQESNLLGNSQIPDNIKIEKFISEYRSEQQFNVYIFPFIKKEGKLFKLSKFDLSIDKKVDFEKKSQKNNQIKYTDTSILSSGRFLKMQIKETGIYKITYDEIRNLGLDPSNVRIFGYGGSVLEEDFSKPYWDDLPQVPFYDNGSYILFYGEGISKSYHNGSSFTHKINPYSTSGYYFITSSNTVEKKNITEQNHSNIATDNQVRHFTDFHVHENEVYNLIKSGKVFYGERFSQRDNNNILNLSFNFPNINTSFPVKVKIDAASKPGTSRFIIKLDDQTHNLTLSIAGLFATGNQMFQFNPSQEQLNFNITHSNSSSSTEGYLNYIEITAVRNLIMHNSYMIFHNTENIGQNSYNKYHLTTSNSNIQIWDITDPVNINKIVSSFTGESLQFIDEASKVKTYIAIDPYAANDFKTILSFSEVSNQNIHGMSPVDMLIIAHPSFTDEAYRLAQAHYDKDNLRVGVVTTDQVYNEFSSGTPDATAYRRAAKMFYDKPQNHADKLKYLLLFGKGSYDNRGIINGSGYNTILTYQADNSSHEVDSYLTDDYFGLLGDNEGKNLEAESIDIGIGRFPVTTVDDAKNVVNKTIGYMQNKDKGGWKNQICFIADDGGDNLKDEHMIFANKMSDTIIKRHPGYRVNKIFLDAYQQETNASGERYPVAKNQFQNLIRSGLFLVNYMGHAGTSGWANEEILNASDIQSLSNEHLPLFTTGSCNFSLFDQQIISGGEHLLLKPVGGSIGTLAAARTVYSSSNGILLQNFCEVLFIEENGEHLRIGEIITKAKNKSGNNKNNLNFVYFGDPALKLNYPDEYKVKITSVNEKDISEQDTLKALSKATIQGIITDKNGTIDENFNGNLKIVLFDKEQEITTLDNHKQNIAFTYKDRINTLFTGKTKVNNGTYSITFMLPKDIRYNYGNGHFNLYAWDDENDKEAQGYFEDFIVGGSTDNYFYEEEGPEVNMYINYPGFVSGTRVNEKPVFVANLHDINGINTSGSTGHDILLCLSQNGKEKFRFVLNDYYEAEQDSYQKGKVSFMMPEIPDGKYTLIFKVWDLLNNSTTKTLDFEVVKGLKPVVYSIINYPNPAIDHTVIEVLHTQESEKITISVDIFDLAGRKMWGFSEYTDSKIHWDLTGVNGKKVSPGIYIYRVSIKEDDKITSYQSNKIIIKQQ